MSFPIVKKHYIVEQRIILSNSLGVGTIPWDSYLKRAMRGSTLLSEH